MKYKQYRQPTRCNNNGLLIIPISSTCFGQLFCPSSGALDCVLQLVVQCTHDVAGTVKQISGKEIYLLIKYIKSVLWRVTKRLPYIEDARCLKVKQLTFI